MERTVGTAVELAGNGSARISRLRREKGSSKVDGPKAEKIRSAKIKLYSEIPYLKSETTKQKKLPNKRKVQRKIQSLIYQPTLHGLC